MSRVNAWFQSFETSKLVKIFHLITEFDRRLIKSKVKYDLLTYIIVDKNMTNYGRGKKW